MEQVTEEHILKLYAKIPFSWKVQTANASNIKCVAYIDSRDVQKLLDRAVKPWNWRDEYKEINGQMFCGVSILINNEWVTKWDTGTESMTEKEKGIVSDSFKRAAVKWGVGRYLYDLEIITLFKDNILEIGTGSQKKYVPAINGKRIYDKNTLTDLCNSKLK